MIWWILSRHDYIHVVLTMPRWSLQSNCSVRAGTWRMNIHRQESSSITVLIGAEDMVQCLLWTTGRLREISGLLNPYPLVYSVGGNTLVVLKCWAHPMCIPASNLVANTKKCKEVLYIWEIWKTKVFNFQASLLNATVTISSGYLIRQLKWGQGNYFESWLSFTWYALNAHPQNMRYWC